MHDPTEPVGRLLFNALAIIAEFERDLISQRTREGMAIARPRGRLRGKQPKLDRRREQHLVEMYREGRKTSAELAEVFGVARSTVYRAVPRRGGEDVMNPHWISPALCSSTGVVVAWWDG